MAVRKFYRDESKLDFWRLVGDNEGLRADEVQLGAVLRIADAVEKMAGPYSRLVQDNEILKQRVEHFRQRVQKLERQLAATRGVVSRMKRERSEGAATHD